MEGFAMSVDQPRRLGLIPNPSPLSNFRRGLKTWELRSSAPSSAKLPVGTTVYFMECNRYKYKNETVLKCNLMARYCGADELDPDTAMRYYHQRRVTNTDLHRMLNTWKRKKLVALMFDDFTQPNREVVHGTD